MYIHICMYIYINTFYSYSTFSHGATVSIPRTWYMAVPKKKRNKNNILVRIFIFFSLKLAFDMMIFYCRLGEGRDKGSSFEFIFKFSPFFVYNFFFSCLKRVHTFVICVCCSSSKGSFSGSESVVSEYR